MTNYHNKWDKRSEKRLRKKVKKFLAVGTVGLSLLSGIYLGSNQAQINENKVNSNQSNQVRIENEIKDKNRDKSLENILDDSLESSNLNNEENITNDDYNIDDFRGSNYLEDRIDHLFNDYSSNELNKLKSGVNEVYHHVDGNGGVHNALKIAAGNYNVIRKNSQKYDIPIDVSIGIMLIESGGSLEGVSHTGNAGIYQLGPHIANTYGLKVNNNIDERFSTTKSTEAAHKYLDRLKNERFGRLDLAILGYHQGEANVGNLVADYINKHKNPESEVQLRDIWKDKIEKYDINLSKLLSDDEITSKYFNENYALNGRRYVHKVLSAADLFNRYLEQNNSFDATVYDSYNVQSGDTLSGISNNYGVSVNDIKRHNPDIRTDNIRVNQRLSIPVGTEERDLSRIRNDYKNNVN